MSHRPDPFYIYVHHKLQECCPIGEELSYKEARIKLARMRLPRSLIRLVLGNMMKQELITKVNRFTIKLNGSEYKEVMLWDGSKESERD